MLFVTDLSHHVKPAHTPAVTRHPRNCFAFICLGLQSSGKSLQTTLRESSLATAQALSPSLQATRTQNASSVSTLAFL